MSDLWTTGQWEAAVLHLLSCDVSIENCAICSVIKTHSLCLVEEPNVTVAEVKQDLVDIGCLPPLADRSKFGRR